MSIELEDLDGLLKTDETKETKPDLEVLKELFKKKEIESKTELTAQQVVLINQKRSIAQLLGWEMLDDCLTDFMLLNVSKDRSGRKEFVEGFVSERESKKINQGQGFFGNIKDKMGF